MIRVRSGAGLLKVCVVAGLPALAAVGGQPTEASAQERWITDFTRRTVELDEIVSGGPPKDGIPAIDAPSFVSVDDADGWLSGREPVAVLTRGDATHIYPLQILIWHEIVNDEVGGDPVTVTFCPLCNTTLAFDRRFDGRVLDFGTTGRLRHSDLVMYDRQTETWWQQATGEGIVGRYAGERLTFVPAPVFSWTEARRSYPDARVLSRETGFAREYGTNPYQGYDRGRPFSWALLGGRSDDRLKPMERVAAIELDGQSVAVPFEALALEKTIVARVGDQRVVVFWSAGTASALDDARISEGRDVGSTAVFFASVAGRDLDFEALGDGRFRDTQTGSTWSLGGEAIEGELVGLRLEPVVHGNHFWFAWSVFKPGTKVVRY